MVIIPYHTNHAKFSKIIRKLHNGYVINPMRVKK